MKKVLFATTALVATAGVAAADVNLSGSAEVGIVKSGSGDAEFHTDIDVNFSMTGETDNGLSFGASVDLDEGGAGAPAHADDTDDGGASFFLAYGSGRLDMGDTDGAFDKVMTEVNLAGGSINDAETAHAGFNGNSGLDGGGLAGPAGDLLVSINALAGTAYDGQIATFSYAFDGFTVAASVEGDDLDIGDAIFGIGASYTGDFNGTSVGAGLGYQTVSVPGLDVSVLGVSVNAGFGNGFSAGVNYSQTDFDAGGPTLTQTHTAFGVGYEMNALAVGLNYGMYDFEGVEADGFGLTVTYDLGGGLVAQFGYGDGDSDVTGPADSWSIGLAMSF